MSQTVIGIFDNENEAQQAVQNLVNQGFSREDVDIASESSTQSGAGHLENTDNSFTSSISNFFSSLFGDDHKASNYSEVARRGSTVTVHARSEAEAERAADILDEYGAVDVDERANQYRNDNSGLNLSGSDFTSTNFNDTDVSSDTNHDMLDNSLDRSIPIINENLEVDRRGAESGSTRLRSRIVEKPVEESSRLRNERVNIERNPVNRETAEGDFNNFQEGTTEMNQHNEIPLVSKDAWLKEEDSLNKEVEEENSNEDYQSGNSNTYTSSKDDLDDDSSLNRENRNI